MAGITKPPRGQPTPSAGTLAGQPIIILREGTRRSTGKEAQENNIRAARAVASAVRTTLGPKGMDKMLVDSLGDIVITNDGATILKEMDIEHPAAKMMVEVAKTQDDEVGDGTTTATVLAGELLKHAQVLLNEDIHPTVINRGYFLAKEKAKEVLDTITLEVGFDDDETLTRIAKTAITGKGGKYAEEKLAGMIVKAVKYVVEEKDGGFVFDIDNIKIEKRLGGKVSDTSLISGIVIDKERVHQNMPKSIEDARILLLNTAVELKKTEVDEKIRVTSPDQLEQFIDQEALQMKKMADKIIESGANVLLCQKGIEDMAQHYLAKAGILAARRVKQDDMEKLSKATGATILSSLEDIKKTDLGKAQKVWEEKVGDEEMIFVTGCVNPKSVSIIIRGGTAHVVDSLETTLHDALMVVGDVLEDGKYVAGGGSPEVEIALRIREYASSLKGREQLAVEKFSDAMEILPNTLAENAGLDQIDMLVSLRSQHEAGHKNVGLNLETGRAEDMLELGVVEPLRIKIQAINSAYEAASMILRIDDVIAATSEGRGRPAPPPGEEEY